MGNDFNRIPKVINYCWFGYNKKTELANRCIDSWKKYAQGYQIVEWNEKNFDINCCEYVKQAYSEKKYAFVSDYARFYILFNNGGIYFDTDVELVAPIDKIIENGSFVGCEPPDRKKEIYINSGLGMAMNKNNHILNIIIDDYNKSNFRINNDKKIETVVVRVTRIFEKYGYDKKYNGIQKIGNITIYPSEYFCPLSPYDEKIKLTDKTVSIHHYDGSWVSKEEKLGNHIQKKYLFFLPYNFSIKFSHILAYYKYNGYKNTLVKICELLRNKNI